MQNRWWKARKGGRLDGKTYRIRVSKETRGCKHI